MVRAKLIIVLIRHPRRPVKTVKKRRISAAALAALAAAAAMSAAAWGNGGPPSSSASSRVSHPAEEEAASAEPAPRPRGRLIIHGAGDVALDPGYVYTLAVHGYDYPWEGLEGLFQADDLTVINLECAVSDLGRPAPKRFNFRCDPAALPAARAAGIEAANLANNHSLDYGREAMLDSIANLRRAGIHPVGAGADYRAAYAPAVIEIKGWTVAVLGFGGVLNSRSWLAAENRSGIASGTDLPDMTAAVERAAEAAYLVVVTIHWGRERDAAPRPGDVERAEAMIAAGADMIFGHHQHRLQPLGWIDGKPVAWGLGNFVWPRLSPQSAAAARVVVHPDGAIGACLVPMEIIKSGRPSFTGPLPGRCDLQYGGPPRPDEPPPQPPPRWPTPWGGAW